MTVTRGSPLLRARRGLAPPLNPLAIATKGWWTTDGAVIIPPLVFCPPIFRELTSEGIKAIAQPQFLPLAAAHIGNYPMIYEVDALAGITAIVESQCISIAAIDAGSLPAMHEDDTSSAGIEAIVHSEHLPAAAVYAGIFPVTHEANIPFLPQCAPYIGEAPNLEFICCED